MNKIHKLRPLCIVEGIIINEIAHFQIYGNEARMIEFLSNMAKEIIAGMESSDVYPAFKTDLRKQSELIKQIRDIFDETELKRYYYLDNKST